MIEMKVVDPRNFADSPFTKKTIKQVKFIPNFSALTKKSLQEKVDKLFSELTGFGLSAEECPLVYLTSSKNKELKVPVKIPYSAEYSSDKNLIDKQDLIVRYGKNYVIKSKINLNGVSYDIVMSANRYNLHPYTLTVFTKDTLNLENTLTVDSMQIWPSSVGVNFDLTKNPEVREMLALIGSRRIPAEFYKSNTRVLGIESDSGLEVSVFLDLRSKNSEYFLQCYEVNLIKGKKFHPEITNIAPETVWQPNQFHYCMADQETFPLIPLDLERVSKLSFLVKSIDVPEIVEAFRGLPLTYDGKNQWFVKMPYKEGTLNFIFNPEWQPYNFALLYSQGSSTFFSAEQVYKGLKGIKDFRKEMLPLL